MILCTHQCIGLGYLSVSYSSVCVHIFHDMYIRIVSCSTMYICISYVPSTWDVQLIQSHFQSVTEGVGRDITSLCHGMALLPLLHCSLLLMLLVTGHWSDQLMERVMHS